MARAHVLELEISPTDVTEILLVSHAKELTDESLLETDKQEVTERKDSY
jgi:hypothetical protein